MTHEESPRDELAVLIHEGSQPEIPRRLDTDRRWNYRAADALLQAGWRSPEEVKQIRREVWDDAHAQMCKTDTMFCSRHRSSFWKEMEES